MIVSAKMGPIVIINRGSSGSVGTDRYDLRLIQSTIRLPIFFPEEALHWAVGQGRGEWLALAADVIRSYIGILS